MKRFVLIIILTLVLNLLLIEGALAANPGLGAPAMKYWGTRLPEDSMTIESPSKIIPAPEVGALIDKYHPQLPQEQKLVIIGAILQSAERHNLDPLLVASVIAAESSFRPRACSRCDARGLMQLTKMVWPYVGVQDPYDIEQNIEGGCIFLAKQVARFQSVELSLAAYNAGPGIVGKLKRIPNYPETINYVKKVTSLANELSDKFEARKAVVTAAYLAANIKSSDPVSSFMPPGRLNEWIQQTSFSEVNGDEATTNEGGWYEAPTQCLPDHKRTFSSICGSRGSQGSSSMVQVLVWPVKPGAGAQR